MAYKTESVGAFEDLGVPVTKALLMATAIGPGPEATGKKDMLYFSLIQGTL